MVDKKELEEQFDLRSEDFDRSAGWIVDDDLIATHVAAAGNPSGKALDLCCGTGRIGTALKKNGWDVTGLDLSSAMAGIASREFRVQIGSAESLPFNDNEFKLAVCRQTFQFLDTSKVLDELKRVLSPASTLVVGLTVPCSEKDRDWLEAIHKVKQPLLNKFYTKETLIREIEAKGFEIDKTFELKVRESVTRWMKYAPELDEKIKQKVIDMVDQAPVQYRDIHNVQRSGDEVYEDWCWVVIRAVNRK